MAGNKVSGDYGEEIAVKYLIDKGYAIVEKKYRCRAGEIDIIARDGGYYVFVEVKLRRNLSKGYPREAVGYSKRQKIIKTALNYFAFKNIRADMRFDVIEIICGGDTIIEHIENAFP